LNVRSRSGERIQPDRRARRAGAAARRRSRRGRFQRVRHRSSAKVSLCKIRHKQVRLHRTLGDIVDNYGLHPFADEVPARFCQAFRPALPSLTPVREQRRSTPAGARFVGNAGEAPSPRRGSRPEPPGHFFARAVEPGSAPTPFDDGYAAPTTPHLDSASVRKRRGMRGRRLVIGRINGLGWAGDTAVVVQAIEAVFRQGFGLHQRTQPTRPISTRLDLPQSSATAPSEARPSHRRGTARAPAHAVWRCHRHRRAATARDCNLNHVHIC
jgi:hypothetical protein